MAKYDGLRLHLRRQSASELEMSFAGIEHRIGAWLPEAAAQAQWWANDEKDQGGLCKAARGSLPVTALNFSPQNVFASTYRLCRSASPTTPDAPQSGMAVLAPAATVISRLRIATAPFLLGLSYDAAARLVGHLDDVPAAIALYGVTGVMRPGKGSHT